MAHLRKQIRDNVVIVLTGLSTTGSRVYASRVYPMAAANLPGLCVYAKSEEVETTTITRPRTQVRTLTLSVQDFAVATSGLDNTLDAISLEVKEALASDPSRSSLVKDTSVETIEAEYVDEGVLLSLALQYGTPATALAKSVARLEDGSPASPVGELIDVIVKEVQAANQSNSQGATNTDVPAEKGQAKEVAWELFTG